MIEELGGLLDTRPLPYFDTTLVLENYYEGDSLGGDGGSGYNWMINPNNKYDLVSDHSMIGSNGYIFADYNRDRVYDQVWFADRDGNWWTCTGGWLAVGPRRWPRRRDGGT